MISRIFLSFISSSARPVLSGFILLTCLMQPAFSQRDYDPNFNHFYMGRQQWTIEDNSPIINNRTGTAPGAMNGALPARAPLPKAGWQGYAPIDNPAPNNNLPKIPGIPKAAKPAPHSASNSRIGHKGQAGNLSPSGINSYKPYSTYANPVNTPNVGTDPNSSTHVKGSLLHWARRPPRQQ